MHLFGCRKARQAGRAFFLCGLLSFLVACESVEGVLSERDEIANRVAESGDLSKFYVKTGKFELAGYQRFSRPGNPVVSIYIEGDGLAFLSANVASRDPSPRDPVSLRLAARDPAANVAYLARPCQYVNAKFQSSCHYTYWTKARFAPEVVQEMNTAVDAIKRASGAGEIRLYGYSGGGVLAAILAGMRTDVLSLATFASPLDHAVWTKSKGFTPLSSSVNAIDRLGNSVRVAQTHFIGKDDDVVPVGAVSSYVEAVRRAGGKADLLVLDGVDHRCCWADRWPGLDPYRETAAAPGS